MSWVLVRRNRYHPRCRYSQGMLKNTNTWITPNYYLNHLFSTSVIDHNFFHEKIVITQFKAPLNGQWLALILETKLRVDPLFSACISKMHSSQWPNTEPESTRKKYNKRQGRCFSVVTITLWYNVFYIKKFTIPS